jgi:hypothetical protein
MSFYESLEKGYSLVPNKIFSYKRNGILTEYDILLLIAIMSLGNFRNHKTSRVQLAKFCGLNRKTINDSMNKLLKLKLIDLESHGVFIKVFSNIMPEVEIKKIQKDEFKDENIKLDQSELDDDNLTATRSCTCPPHGHVPDRQTVNKELSIEINKEIYIKDEQSVKESKEEPKQSCFDTHLTNSNLIDRDKDLYDKDILKIRDEWIRLGLRYESTSWEFQNLRLIAEEVCKHPCSTLDILDAIGAYSSELKDKDSIYTYQHSITSFFGSKGAWKQFLKGHYFKGIFSRKRTGIQKTEEELEQARIQRVKELSDYLEGER